MADRQRLGARYVAERAKVSVPAHKVGGMARRVVVGRKQGSPVPAAEVPDNSVVFDMEKQKCP